MNKTKYSKVFIETESCLKSFRLSFLAIFTLSLILRNVKAICGDCIYDVGTETCDDCNTRAGDG
jgi:hypothetical protein